MDVTTYLIGGVSAIALITGLVKVIQEAGLPSKFAPAVSVCLGIVIGVSSAFYADSAILVGILGGIAAGLSACGLYDLGKKST